MNGSTTTVFLIVTDTMGTVVNTEAISAEEFECKKYKDCVKILARVVHEKAEELKGKYPEPDYVIHMAAGDSLVSVLRSFPEIRRPKSTNQVAASK